MPYSGGSKPALGNGSKDDKTTYDENVDTIPTRSMGGPSKDPTDNTMHQNKTPLKTKPSIAPGSQWTMLNDKSNRISQPLSKSADKGKEKYTAVSKQRDHPALTTDPAPKHSSLQAPTKTNPSDPRLLAAAANEAIRLKAFFQDNKQHDEPKSAMSPTPVLPIVVPDRMKPLLRRKYLGSYSRQLSDSTLGRYEQLVGLPKRQTSGKDNENISNSAMPQSPSLTEPPATMLSTLESSKDQQPTLTLEVSQQTYDQVKELERQQEQRAHQNGLQGNTTLRYNADTNNHNWMNDPMLVANYTDDINAHLRATEYDTMVDPNYITIQNQVTWQMRDLLVDWINGIHDIFHLLPETFYLAVNIIDRFLSKRDISLAKLQMLGITSLFVASKFEESFYPPIRHYIYMTGYSVTENDLIQCELYILQTLDFKMCYPHPLYFLRRCTTPGQFDLNLRILGKYLIEIAYIDHRFLATPPSLLAASALWLSLKILGQGPWTPELAKLTEYKEEDLNATIELTMDYLSQPIMNSAFFKKWASKRMLKVSIFVRAWVEQFYSQEI